MSTTRIKVIGTTRIIEPLAKGGMAEVFRGIQEPLQREVAVKVMLPEVARDREAVTRFRREALALAALQHENIVSVYDMVEKNGQFFMILEFVEGIDLADLSKGQKQMPLDITLLVAAGIAGALEHAHFRKVIHRDIKPANIMVSRLGEVKLTDFGIAKDLTIDDMTRTGMVVGTPSYLSPEQVAGRRPDHRTDIYSLGVVLYLLLTGRKPYLGENHGSLFAAISRGKRPKIRKLAPGIPRAVEKIVERCMELDPDKRYQRAAQLRRDLEQQISRLLVGTGSARLVAYLRDQGHIIADDISGIDQDELWYVEGSNTTRHVDDADILGAQRGGLRKFAGRVAVIALLLGAGSAAAWQFAPEQTAAVVDKITGLFASDDVPKKPPPRKTRPRKR